MDINNCVCPLCKSKLLYIQSKFNGSKVAFADINVAVKYSIQCYWCAFEFGACNSKTELLEAFNKKYGGI